MRLRPECPWRARRYTIVLEESVQYWNLFLFPPPPAKHAFQRLSDQWGQYKKYFWRFSLILQNWTAPSSSWCTCFPWRRRWINFFDISWSETEYFPGSTSVQVLFPIGTALGEEPTGSLLCVFALAFNRHAKSFASNFNAYSSSWTFGISCSLLFKIHQKLVWSMRNSDPRVRIVCSQTKFWSQLRTYRASNWVQFPIRVQFWCSLGSILLVVMLLLLLEEYLFTTGHCMKLWEFHSVFRHEVLSNFKNIQKSCIHTKFVQFVFLW